MEFTKEEWEFMTEMLSQINIKASSPVALQSVTMVQSILKKINEKPKDE